jgi:hypothetical protein
MSLVDVDFFGIVAHYILAPFSFFIHFLNQQPETEVGGLTGSQQVYFEDKKRIAFAPRFRLSYG